MGRVAGNNGVKGGEPVSPGCESHLRRSNVITWYRGREEWGKYLAELERINETEGGTVSPGGGATMLGYTRQMINYLVKNEGVRAWAYSEGIHRRATYMEVSVWDLIAHGIKTGRLKGPEDVALKFPRLKDLFDSVKTDVLPCG